MTKDLKKWEQLDEVRTLYLTNLSKTTYHKPNRFYWNDHGHLWFEELSQSSLTYRLHNAILVGPKIRDIEPLLKTKRQIELERVMQVVTKICDKNILLINTYLSTRRISCALNEKVEHHINYKWPVHINVLGLLIGRVIIKNEYGGSPEQWGYEARATLKLLLQRG